MGDKTVMDRAEPCILCGGGRFVTRFTGAGPQSSAMGCRIISCRQCGLTFKQPDAAGEDCFTSKRAGELVSDQSQPSREFISQEPDKFMSPGVGMGEIEEIGRFRSPPGTFLNVGSDCSAIMEAARLSGWHSRWAADLPEPVVESLHQPLGHFSFVDRFDVIRLEGSLERSADPEAYLRQAAKALNHDGLLVITTPDCQGWDFMLYGQGESLWPIDLPNWFFTPSSLKRLMARSGYRILRVSHFDATYECPPVTFSSMIAPQIPDDVFSIVGVSPPLSYSMKVFRILARPQRRRINDLVRGEAREPIQNPEQMELQHA